MNRKYDQKPDMISVIVPVYNVQDYLPRCLESICSQTYGNLEIILIDDGSTDDSPRICREFAERDPRIRYIRTENSGVSAARNRGIGLAQGRWIGFLDSDDYVEPDFYEKLEAQAVLSGKKIVCSGVRAQDPEGNRIERMKGRMLPDAIQDFDREEALQRYLNPDTRILYWAVWNKLYDADLVKELSFEEGRITAEDFDFCLHCILRADGIRYLPEELYHYLVRPGSAITSGTFSKDTFDRVFFTDRALREVREAGAGTETVRCAQINRELTMAKILHAFHKKRADKNAFREELEYCREALRSCSHEVSRAPLARAGRENPWYAVTMKSKVLCFMAEHCEKLLRFF